MASARQIIGGTRHVEGIGLCQGGGAIIIRKEDGGAVALCREQGLTDRHQREQRLYGHRAGKGQRLIKLALRGSDTVAQDMALLARDTGLTRFPQLLDQNFAARDRVTGRQAWIDQENEFAGAAGRR